MTTAFAAIAGAIKDALEAGAPVSSMVERARLHPIPATQADAVVIRLQSSTPERFAILNGPTDWETVVAIECYARSNGSASVDEAADALLSAVWTRLTTDSTLGGMGMDFKPTGLEYDFEGANDKLACITLSLTVLHRTQNNSLE